MYTTTSLLALANVLPTALCASLWQNTTPQTPQPYALKKNHGVAIVGGETLNTFPVTGNSSSGAFTLMNTNGPGSANGSSIFPHVHRATYENFYAAKGRVQLWGQNYDSYVANSSVQTSRILSQGDFGGIPMNTIHTFLMLEPDTTLTGVLVPGGFEEFFFATGLPPSGGEVSGPLNVTELALWDVYPQLNFTPRADVVDGKAGPGNWYDGPNELPADDKSPVWVAKNYGPKYLNSEAGYYQLVAPLVTSTQTGRLFGQGHVTMSPKAEGVVAPGVTSPQATAFMVEEGMLVVEVDGFDTARLIDGDVVFVPANTTFSYYAEADFTKFMYVSGGDNGLDAMLLDKAEDWSSAFYPRDTSNVKRGFKI
ncbi:RmlC-like cupin [Corynespora cassiicola Philippines]|uniref:RmlC-like cupin n=1 Tax=Corynespora cassiicola Philippines TaxID=1448308 RepID=A0A2T2N217_CORCC|nr:RmlC-like cupin [Corynespora cassiicola Philippines]